MRSTAVKYWLYIYNDGKRSNIRILTGISVIIVFEMIEMIHANKKNFMSAI